MQCWLRAFAKGKSKKIKNLYPYRKFCLSNPADRGIISSVVGMWHSLVARFVRDEEAAGSNPVIPTRYDFKRHSHYDYAFFICRNINLLKSHQSALLYESASYPAMEHSPHALQTARAAPYSLKSQPLYAVRLPYVL